MSIISTTLIRGQSSISADLDVTSFRPYEPTPEERSEAAALLSQPAPMTPSQLMNFIKDGLAEAAALKIRIDRLQAKLAVKPIMGGAPAAFVPSEADWDDYCAWSEALVPDRHSVDGLERFGSLIAEYDAHRAQ